MQKQCNKCLEYLGIENFGFHKGTKDSRDTYCKKCIKEYHKQRKQYLRLRSLDEIIEPDYKICSHCKLNKNINEFHKNILSVDGRSGECKICTKERVRRHTEKIFKNQILVERKVCTSCNLEKEISYFYTRKDSKDGYRRDCKSCKDAKDCLYKRNNKEKRNRTSKLWRDKNPEKVKKSRDRNKIKNSELKKKLRRENPEKYREKSRKYYQNNKQKILDQTKDQRIQYYYNNQEKIIKKQREYLKNKLATDIEYKLRSRLRSRISSAIKNDQGKKSARTVELLGCSVKEARTYLESLWVDGMDWTNYGKHGWHIDHIIPCCAFDLTNSEEQRKCFHYTNLQPLWAKDNLSKMSNDLKMKKPKI